MEFIGNSPHGDGVHPVGTKFAPLATEFIPWGQNSPCGVGIHHVGMELIPWGQDSSCWGGISPMGMEFTPLGTEFTPWGSRGRPHSHRPSLNLDQHNQQRKWNHFESYFLFLFSWGFLFVCLEYFWLVCLDGFLFICFCCCCFLVFWEEISAFPAGQAQGGEEVVVVDIPNPWLLCSPFPGLPSSCTWNFTPSWRIFPQNQGSVPSMATAPNSQMPPSCRATPSVPLSPCHLSWLCAMDPMDNWDGRALDASFLVETTQNFCCSGAAQAAGWEWREQIPHTGHEGGAGLISATELKRKKCE